MTKLHKKGQMLLQMFEKCFKPHRTGRQVDLGYCDAVLEYTMLSDCDTFHLLLFQNAESSPVITHLPTLNEITCTKKVTETTNKSAHFAACTSG